MTDDLQFLGIAIVPMPAKTSRMALHFQNEHKT
jgi:hypothetical protein